jgi:hypothetical protein
MFTMTRNEPLQSICRGYLRKLRYMARKHGLLPQLNALIVANRNGSCSATEKEVNALSRLCDDELLSRKEIPRVIGKSYRKCEDDGTFDHIKKLRYLGIYSKVDVLLRKTKVKSTNKS